MRACFILLWIFPILISCQSVVSRAESMAIAQAYCDHQWTPSHENILHGPDKDGIIIETPDIAFKKQGVRPGWWKPHEVNTGIPYQWGGFDTPLTFDQKISRGFAAGDVYTKEKRKALEQAVSKQACGLDCSGFVSRCWKLPRAYSTRELAALCDPLASFDDLKPGDILNKENDHVILFAGFYNPQKTRFIAYETGCPPTWKTLRHHISMAFVKGEGYQPYRYRWMQE